MVACSHSLAACCVPVGLCPCSCWAVCFHVEAKVLLTVNSPVNYIGTIKINMVVLVVRVSFQCCFQHPGVLRNEYCINDSCDR